jgi:hypothetical protein
MNGLRFVPEHAIAGIPNVVVDGAPNPDTVLTLSHWPGAPTPPSLREDLSAQIAFRALEQPELFDGIEAVTNNHFDQDGLVSAFTLLYPDLALPRREQLVDIARAGDFGTFESRDSARVAMVIAALDDDLRSPLDDDVLSAPYPQRCGAMYEWALPRLLDIIDHLDEWSHLWADEDGHLEASLDAIGSGEVSIGEYPDVDLAVFTVPEEWTSRATSRFTVARSDRMHPMAVANSTQCMRVATIDAGGFTVELRYETWVMHVSRPLAARPDLRELAQLLNHREGVDAWVADAPGSLTPQLRREGSGGTLAPPEFVTLLRDFLSTAPPAWDPFQA